MMKIPRFNYAESIKKNISLETQIKELANKGQISIRAYNVCLRYKILTLGDLLKIGENFVDFIPLRNCGRKTALELYALIKLFKSSRKQDKEFYEYFEECPDFICEVFIKWFESIKSNSTDEYKNFLTKLIPSVGKIYDLLLIDPSLLLKAKEYDIIDTDKIKFQYRKNLIKNLSELNDILQNLSSIDVNTLKIISNIKELPIILKKDFPLDFFKYDIPIEIKTFLTYNLDNLIKNAPARARTLYLSQIKNIEGIIVYLNLEMAQFLSFFGNKKKGAIDFYTKVLIPFKETYDKIISQELDNIDITIKLKFSFLKEEDIRFVKSFFSNYNHFPMFYISHAFIINTEDREHNILCMKYGLGKYKPHRLDQIAGHYSLTRERVRQILAKSILKKNQLFHYEEWEPYFVLGNTFITEHSDYYKNIIRHENLNISFESFALIFTSVFNYKYIDKPIEYLVDNKYAKIIQNILEKFILLKEQNYSEDVYFTLSDVLPKVSVNDDYICNLIYTEICPLLQIKIKDNRLFFEQNHIDIAYEIYNYLYSCGEPQHLEDIKNHLLKKYPNKSFSDANLKFRIREHSSILPVGKSSKYKLKHWRNIYGGSIRSLIRDILNDSETPLALEIIADKVTDLYESTSKKSVHSSMCSCEDFVPYSGGLWGLVNKRYNSEFTIVDLSRTRNSFEERFEQYKAFVEEFRRLPYLSGIEEEDSLKRWQMNVFKKNLDVSDEQIKILQEYIHSQADLPQNGREVRFYKTCKEYLDFVEENFELPKHPSPLFYWFNKTLSHYSEYEDNKKFFFGNLIKELNSYGFYF